MFVPVLDLASIGSATYIIKVSYLKQYAVISKQHWLLVSFKSYYIYINQFSTFWTGITRSYCKCLVGGGVGWVFVGLGVEMHMLLLQLG